MSIQYDDFIIFDSLPSKAHHIFSHCPSVSARHILKPRRRCRRLTEEKGKGSIINMIFESENYSPLERVDEGLRRRVLDEMSQWENSAPAMSGCVRGCGSPQPRVCDRRQVCEVPKCVPCRTCRPSEPTQRCRCGCPANRCKDASQDTETSYTAGCTDDSPSLAMVYSPKQHWRGLYCVSEGLDCGTIFRELNFPFYPTPCRKGGGCCDR